MRWPLRHLLCPQCGYDLAGTIASGQRRCPECGEPFEESELRRAPRPGEWTLARGLTQGAVLLVVAVILLGVVWAGVLWLLGSIPFSRGLDFLLAAILGYVVGHRLTNALTDRAGFQSWVWLPVVVLAVTCAVAAGTTLFGLTASGGSAQPMAAVIFVVTTGFTAGARVIMD